MCRERDAETNYQADPFYYPLRNWWHRLWWKKRLADWEARGCPAPPPHAHKQRVLREYAERYDLRVLVETGTFRGDMVEAMKRTFDQIYSIELSQTLFEEARRRFKSETHIQILQGDSASVLGDVMKKINAPALFCWMVTIPPGRLPRARMTRPSMPNWTIYCTRQARAISSSLTTPAISARIPLTRRSMNSSVSCS